MKRIIRRLKNSHKAMVSFYLLSILVYIITLVLLDISILKLSGIETTYRIILIVGLTLYFFLYLFRGYNFVVRRKRTKFILLTILTLILSGLFCFGAYTINYLYGELDNLVEDDMVRYTTNLIALKDTKFNNSSSVGIIKNEEDIEGNILALELMKEKKLPNKVTYYENYDEMLNDLYHQEIDGIFVSSNYQRIFQNDYPNIGEETKVIYEYSKLLSNKDKKLMSNKTLDEPFTILLMGVDTDSEEGVKSNSAFNGDTLMLISFNPHTLNASVFSIPRDLYVPISCRNNAKAKINSSAAGGTSCVLDTIENLTGIPIDYYAKINFQGVVDLVNAVDGVDVDVGYKFCEQDSKRNMANKICLDVGYQHLDGEQALAFARHRHSLPTGDLTRIQNQQLLVEAIAKKAVTLNSLSEVRDVLNVISNNISLNMETDQLLSGYDIIKSLVKNAINGEEILNLQRTYLEVYDANLYNPYNGLYQSILGYYQDSLDDITKFMKVNLELEEREMIKTFKYDANTEYELYVPGKGISTGGKSYIN